ncbi:MAG: hypothetical protein KF777_14550 [Planctomycetaceae bacterium]|nr:hypothetical protein [Planctomycetaceae bacterium]
MGKRQPTTQELMRLDAIAKHLKIKSRYPADSFTAAVIDTCLDRIAPVVEKLLPCSGEQIALGLGEHLHLTFEEVRGPADVTDLLKRYLQGKKEIGFAQVPEQLTQPGVDALLFERMHAQEQDPDRWVAVLNLQDSDAKGYWNRFHELSHRIAEPPQGILPFKRHQIEASNPVETLMDAIAAEFGFYEPAFRPLVEQRAQRSRLTFSVVEYLRRQFAPTASLLSTMKAVVKFWPQPAAVLVSEFRGRVGAPHLDQALRVTPQGHNGAASNSGLKFIFNMRVPQGSPIDLAFQTGVEQNELERLGNWTTSQGKRLASLNVHTSARRIGKRVYSLISAGS